jgi:hypothetical protein
MKKFTQAFKEKLQEHENLQENKILSDFRSIYNAMLENYNIKAIHDLDDESQLSFLTELSHYWSEEEGLSEKGEKFIEKRSLVLNENSTAVQKKNFLKTKIANVINETLRQAELKWKIYDVIDTMYEQLSAADLRDILSPEAMVEIINESLNKSISELSNKINKELTDSAKETKKYIIKKRI